MTTLTPTNLIARVTPDQPTTMDIQPNKPEPTEHRTVFFQDGSHIDIEVSNATVTEIYNDLIGGVEYGHYEHPEVGTIVLLLRHVRAIV